tara:strand:- start:1612 stop:2070 length:459 start_codon:yes stop_codon:yes gene_type:complete
VKSNIEIRNVVKDDLPKIFQIEEDTFAPMHYPLFVLRQFYDILSDLFFVAVNEHNDIKGYSIGGIDHDSKMGWIFALAVVQSEQKKKIGQRITVELLKAFEDKNIGTVQLTTTPDNNAAIKLYEKLGFIKVTEKANYYLDNSPRLIMRLKSK